MASSEALSAPAALRAARVDVAAIVDDARFAGLPLRVTLLALLVLVLDGFDIQAVAFAAPALASQWGIGREALGPVLASGLIGMAVGATSLGWLADRRGRRQALLISIVILALGSLACATARSLDALVFWRFIAGIGIGGPLPVATALVTEFAPRAWRSIAVALGVIGIPLGGLVGAAIAERIVPAWGWPSIFIAGGVLPLAMLVVLVPYLPESPRFLASRASLAPRLAALLNRLVGREAYRGDEQFYLPEPVLERPGVFAVLAREHRRKTLLLWLVFFTNVFAVYVFFNWLPTVLSAAGLPLAVALRGSVMFNVGGVVGAMLVAAMLSRVGSRALLSTIAAGSIVATFALSRSSVLASHGAGAGLPALMWTMALAGACINGVQVGLYTVAAQAYPTLLRASGVGWAGGVARFGGILSAAAGAAFFALGLEGADFFAGIAAICGVTLVVLLVLPAHYSPGRFP